MKLVSFNINGVRARPHQLQALVERHAPDVVGLQETKVQDPDFPVATFSELGYAVDYFGQKSHYGVALMSRQAPENVAKGYPFDPEDAQRRIIAGTYRTPSGKNLTVINGYFPQGEARDHETKFPAKRQFYADLVRYLEENFSPNDLLAVMGDLNIAPQDADIGIGADNAKRWLRTGKCSFLPEEREWLERLMDWGLIDTFGRQHADQDDDSRLSWFDYRSRGFEREPKRGLRIDAILATEPLFEQCTGSGIDHAIRGMEKPSDHCPVWAEFAL